MEDLKNFPYEVLTVHELTSRIRGRLEEAFPAVWVTGEISNLKTPYSGHTYFTLKDDQAQIQAVFFKHRKRYIRFEPEDGMQALCKCVVTVYEARGTVQISVDYMEPMGLGALHLAFEQIKERLEKEGLFDPAHKKKLPLLPQRIGVITSPTGAAIQDILNIISRRFANVEILIAPVHVQGESAAPEIVEAMEVMNRREDLDVIILARGGGSLEDLWPFNEEKVARAIYSSSIPVISAVGHETDFTIADFVADFRAPTPSAAAELVVQNKAEIQARIAAMEKRLQNQAGNILNRVRSGLEIFSRRLISPEQRLNRVRQRLDDLNEDLNTSLRHRLDSLKAHIHGRMNSLRFLSPMDRVRELRGRLKAYAKKNQREIMIALQGRRDRLSALSARLETLNPLNVLHRGYSIVYKLPEGKIITESRKISLNDRLRIHFHSGKAECTVDHIEEG
ncbi:MAG: exodeoxyribonuclease VII large subunit [bacterium]